MPEVPALTPPAIFTEQCDAIGLKLTDDEVAQLGRFLHLLLETNKRFNLTGIKDPDVAWLRHVLDSLSVFPCLEGVETLADVGTGGGLPGIPLAIVRPDMRVTLMEATGKKANFCIDTAKALGLKNVAVVNERAETIGQDRRYRAHFDAAIARAVGPMNVMLELTLPLVKIGGRVLAMKGRSVEDELRDIGDALVVLGGGEIAVFDALPGVEDEAVIVQVAKERTTISTYPRRPGIPKQEPL
ncbi:MAG: 16S rRNA (guanine(527)-N(7))-methyltransferase RsmG [Phycisphaera sp.]|nr:16S rRNA (guanine(527)-N(7))-methyltransferase RsmG [Phycisphaera sp.]